MPAENNSRRPIRSESTPTTPKIINCTISVTINDTTYYDNAWYKSGGITDRTGVTFSPGQ